MRGTPALRLLLMAAALLLAGVPVWSLTRPDAAPRAVEAPATTPDRTEVRITLTASAPARLGISVLGEELIPAGTPSTGATIVTRMDPAHPDDVVVRAEWPEDATEQALRVEIEQTGKAPTVSTFWGRGSVEDVVTP